MSLESKTYYLDEEKTRPITAAWTSDERNIRLFVQKQLIANFKTKKELSSPKMVDLGNGESIRVQWHRLDKMDIRLDGVPAVGTKAHALSRLNYLGNLAYILASVFGLFGVVTLISPLFHIVATIVALALCVGFVPLGYALKTRHSTLAFFVMVVVLGLLLVWTAFLNAGIALRIMSLRVDIMILIASLVYSIRSVNEVLRFHNWKNRHKFTNDILDQE